MASSLQLLSLDRAHSGSFATLCARVPFTKSVCRYRWRQRPSNPPGRKATGTSTHPP